MDEADRGPEGPPAEGSGVSQLYYCERSGELEIHPGGGFDVCCDKGPSGHEPIPGFAYSAIRHQVAEEIASAIEDKGDELADFSGPAPGYYAAAKLARSFGSDK